MSPATLSFLALTLLAKPAPPAPAPIKTALLPLVAPDLAATDRDEIEDALRHTLEGISALALQTKAATAKNLASAKDVGAGCAFESLSCQTSLGVLTGVDRVVVARVAPDWSGDLLQLRLLDVLEGTVIRETVQKLPKTGGQRAVVLQGALLRVVAPDRTGGVVIKTNSDAAIWLDGVELDKHLVNAPVDGLSPGKHLLELHAGDKKLAANDAVVKAGERVTVILDEPGGKSKGDGPKPPAAKGLSIGSWVTGAGAVVAVGAGAGAGGLALWLETPIQNPTRQSVRGAGVGLVIATGVGVVAAGVGVALLMTEGGT